MCLCFRRNGEVSVGRGGCHVAFPTPRPQAGLSELQCEQQQQHEDEVEDEGGGIGDARGEAVGPRLYRPLPRPSAVLRISTPR